MDKLNNIKQIKLKQKQIMKLIKPKVIRAYRKVAKVARCLWVNRLTVLKILVVVALMVGFYKVSIIIDESKAMFTYRNRVAISQFIEDLQQSEEGLIWQEIEETSISNPANEIEVVEPVEAVEAEVTTEVIEEVVPKVIEQTNTAIKK